MFNFSLLIFTFLALLTSGVQSFVCTTDFCAGVQCEPVKVEDCNGPNHVVKPGGFCGCCNLCHTILNKGEECSNLQSVLLGLPPPTKYCGQGLVCLEGKCVEISQSSSG